MHPSGDAQKSLARALARSASAARVTTQGAGAFQSAAMARTISEPVASFVSALPPAVARLGASREGSCSSVVSPGSSFALTTARDGRASVGGMEVWERMESDPPSANEHQHPSSRSPRVYRTPRHHTAAEAGWRKGGSISSVARSASLSRDRSRDSLGGYSHGEFKRSASLDLVASRPQPVPEPDEGDEDEDDYDAPSSVDPSRRRKLPSYRSSPPFPSKQHQHQQHRPRLTPPNKSKSENDRGLTRERATLSRKKPRLGRCPSSPFIVEPDDARHYYPSPSSNPGSSFGDLLEAVHRVGFNSVAVKWTPRVLATPTPNKAMTAGGNLSPTGTILETTSEEEEEDDGYEGDKTFSSVGTSASAERIRGLPSDPMEKELEDPRDDAEDEDADGEDEDEEMGPAADKAKLDLDERDRECAQLLLGLGGAAEEAS
jgi:hypothetical protein